MLVGCDLTAFSTQCRLHRMYGNTGTIYHRSSYYW